VPRGVARGGRWRLGAQGKYLEALECMERGLVLRQHLFGGDADEVWDACRSVGELCNMLAMSYLQQGPFRCRDSWCGNGVALAEDFGMVMELLKKAEILTERDAAGRAVTYNNLACYYRRVGRLHAALKFLKKALSIEARLEKVTNPADTHLNVCAVLSQLGRHAEALRHCQAALRLIQRELFG
jgi:tetratricopeptide (TPR) repeat protein